MAYSLILKRDFENLYNNYNFTELKNSNIFITGANGLVGKNIVLFLDFLNTFHDYKIKIFALVRNEIKANEIKEQLDSFKNICFVFGDVRNCSLENNLDYIVHCASITSSKLFVEKPVETIDIAVNGTMNILNIAKEKNIKSMVYLSSMEVFGVTDQTLQNVKEQDLGYIDILNPRSSYSEGKRICETLCASYSVEYDIPVKIARLAQTFGPGINYKDSRVCAMFARSVIENKDIVLKTKGKTKRPLVYTSDATSGIITLLLKGRKGESYTIADENTFMSVREIAEMIISKIAHDKIKLLFDFSDNAIYPPDFNLNLCTEKLRTLEWMPSVGIEEGFENMITYMKETRDIVYE